MTPTSCNIQDRSDISFETAHFTVSIAAFDFPLTLSCQEQHQTPRCNQYYRAKGQIFRFGTTNFARTDQTAVKAGTFFIRIFLSSSCKVLVAQSFSKTASNEADSSSNIYSFAFCASIIQEEIKVLSVINIIEISEHSSHLIHWFLKEDYFFENNGLKIWKLSSSRLIASSSVFSKPASMSATSFLGSPFHFRSTIVADMFIAQYLLLPSVQMILISNAVFNTCSSRSFIGTLTRVSNDIHDIIQVQIRAIFTPRQFSSAPQLHWSACFTLC